MREQESKVYMNYPLNQIIEAVVTNNLGYIPHFREFNVNSGFNIVDCKGMNYEDAKKKDPNKTKNKSYFNKNIANLHLHLGEMDHYSTIWFSNRFEKTMPKFIFQEVTNYYL